MEADRPPTRGLPIRPPRIVIAVAAVVILLESGLRFSYKYLEKLAFRSDVSPLPDLINELTGGLGAFVLFLALIYPLCVRFALRRGELRGRIPLHGAGVVVYSALHTSFNAISRELAYPLFGMDFDYGSLSVRFPMEFAGDVFGYAVLALAVHAFLHYRELRDRELHAARLQSELGEAQLSALRARLHPHFLFNTINTISASVYRDPAAADRMLGGLSRLLRRALAAEPGAETTVSEEVATLDTYLDIMRERFGDRLDATIAVGEGLEEALLPPFVLQPLVENAVGHGIGPRAGGGAVRVGISAVGDRLRLEVADDGVGVREPEGAMRSGIGLSATRERLAHLYGDAATLRLEPRAGGGTVASVELPLRRNGAR
ncbi:MAG: histidine kinase [Gemmatimonadota bacterium]